MTRTLALTGLRDLVRRPLHTGLMVLGIGIGVAVVVSVDLASGSARRAFALSSEAVTGRATHRVVGGPEGLPQELLLQVRVEAGIRASTPVVEGTAIAVDFDRQPLRVLGTDALSDAPFRPRSGGDWRTRPGFSRFLTDPRAVLVSAAFAARHRLGIGSPLRLQVQDRVETLEVAGIVHGGDEGGSLEGLVLLDVGAAQRLFRLGDRLSRIDLITDAAGARRLRRVLPPSARVVPASEQAGAVGQLADAFLLNLTALSLLALVVGMFLIYNTVMFGVVQRRAVLGTLRLLGATSGQVFASVLLEAAAASALGTALGLGAGWLLAQGVVRLVTRTINDLYFVLAVSGAPLTASAAARALLLGMGAGLLSAVPAALEAARVAPSEALRRSTIETRARGLAPRAAGLGLALAVLAGLALLVSRSVLAGFASLFAIVMGAALAAPLATVAAMGLLGPPAGRLAGTLGRMAARTVARSVSRTGVAVAALAVAVSVTVGVGLMIESFRSTVENWLDLTLRADVFVAAPAPGGARPTAVLAPDVPARVAAVPGVDWVETFHGVRVGSPRGDVNLAVADPRRARDGRLYRFADGDPAAVWEKVRQGAVLVSEPFAFRRGLPPHGGKLVLFTDRGPRTFEVAGVFYDYSTEQGTVLLTRDVYQRFWDDRGVSSLGVHLSPGASAEDVADALRRALAGTALQVTPNRSLRRTALRIFDRTFAVTRALRLLAVVVAFVGIWSALMALQLERTRELATLSALGLAARQEWGLTLLESGLMGLVAGALALPLGAFLALALIHVINVRSFGWTMRLELDPLLFAQALGLSVGSALLACVYPLLRRRRLPLAEALRAE